MHTGKLRVTGMSITRLSEKSQGPRESERFDGKGKINTG